MSQPKARRKTLDLSFLYFPRNNSSNPPLQRMSADLWRPSHSLQKLSETFWRPSRPMEQLKKAEGEISCGVWSKVVAASPPPYSWQTMWKQTGSPRPWHSPCQTNKNATLDITNLLIASSELQMSKQPTVLIYTSAMDIYGGGLSKKWERHGACPLLWQILPAAVNDAADKYCHSQARNVAKSIVTNIATRKQGMLPQILPLTSKECCHTYCHSQARNITKYWNATQKLPFSSSLTLCLAF